MSPAAAAQSQPAGNVTNGPDDDAVVAVNLGKIRDAKMRVDAAGNELRSVTKHAEGKGVHLKAAARALKIVKAGDADSWLEETSAITRYLKILRHGVTENQLSLELESTLAPIEEKAGLDGRACGLDTADTATEGSIPHDLSTRAGQSWLAAFRQGRTERDIILSMRDDVDTDDEDLDGEED